VRADPGKSKSAAIVVNVMLTIKTLTVR